MQMKEEEKELVYLDITIGGIYEGRIIIELFTKIAPKTCKNFLELCKGEVEYNGKKLSYKGSIFYRVMKGFIIQGGDIENNDGTGGRSIYGEFFEDETFEIKHEEGIVSMANNGKNTNGSQFFIVTDQDIAEIDGQNVAFGKVYKGMDVVKSIENQKTKTIEDKGDKPIDDCVISDCGEWKEGMKIICQEDNYPIYPKYCEEEDPNYLEIAKKIKNNGNEKFSTGKYKEALNLYKKSLRYLMYFVIPSSKENDNSEITNEFHSTSVSLHLNQAACYLKMEDYDSAIVESTIVLDHPRALKNEKVKAFYRKGISYMSKQQYKEAFDSLKQASSLNEGKDDSIKKALLKAAEELKKEKELLTNMSNGIISEKK